MSKVTNKELAVDGCISFQKLKELCEQYDKEYGKYPESEYEGAGIYKYILQQLGLIVPDLEPLRRCPSCDMPTVTSTGLCGTCRQDDFVMSMLGGLA